MKLYLILLFALFAPLAAQASFFDDAPPPDCIAGNGVSFEPKFSSPSAAISGPAIKAILSAKKSIRIAARNFMSKPVSEAIVKAGRANIDIKMVLDRNTSANPASAAQFLSAMSMSPHVTRMNAMLYSDYIIIDDKDLVLGNIFQATDAEEEERSSSDVLIIRNAPDLAKQYLANWQTLWNASEPMPKEKKS